MRQVTASAPGKFVILGEHAVVYGKPAISLAINRRFRVSVRPSRETSVNGGGLQDHPHVRHILSKHDYMPVSISMNSEIPSGSGLGSSAALSSALALAMNKMDGMSCSESTVAEHAYYAEYRAQGNMGSPMDTSCTTHGKGIALNIPDCKDRLWTLSNGKVSWNVSNLDVPKMTFVIGYTGIRAPTAPLVDKVRRYRESNRFAFDMVEEIGKLALDGMNAISKDDRVGLGELMTKDHKLLSILGVSCKELNKLVDASLPHSYGAKLTGSGGGGCMVALTDKPEKVSEVISAHGGIPIEISTGEEGVRMEGSRRHWTVSSR